MLTEDAVKPIAYSIATASRVSGIGRTKLYQLIREGHLRSIKRAGRRLIMKSDLIRYLESGSSDEVSQ